jgi:hypothetical protein
VLQQEDLRVDRAIFSVQRSNLSWGAGREKKIKKIKINK